MNVSNLKDSILSCMTDFEAVENGLDQAVGTQKTLRIPYVRAVKANYGWVMAVVQDDQTSVAFRDDEGGFGLKVLDVASGDAHGEVMKEFDRPGPTPPKKETKEIPSHTMSGYAAIIHSVPVIWVSEKTNCHRAVVKEFKLKNPKISAHAFDFYPDQCEPSSDVSTWKLAWNQLMPERHRKVPSKTFVEATRPLIEDKAWDYIYDEYIVYVSKGRIRGWAFNKAHVECHNSTIVAFDDTYISANETCEALALGRAEVHAHDTSQVTGRGNAEIHAHGNAVVRAHEDAKVHATSHARIMAFGKSRIYAADDVVVEAYGDASVAASGRAVVNGYGAATHTVIGDAVWIDRTGEIPAVWTAKGKLD